MKKSFTLCGVPFRSFRPFSCPLHLEYYRTAVSEVSKVRPISAYRWNLNFFIAWSSLLHKEETLLNILGKEVDLARNLFPKKRIYHKSINLHQSVSLGRRATLHREGLMNVNRNSHKAVYKKEDFKCLDRRRSFSISLNVCQTILESSRQMRSMFDVKKLL